MDVTFKPIDQANVRSMGIDAVRLSMLNELRKLAREMQKDLQSYVEVFDNPPDVVVKRHLTRRQPMASVEVFVDDYRIELLDKGTPGHMVKPVRAKALRWRRRKPKTRPNSLKTRRTNYTGPYRYSKGHYVRGIKARNIGKTLAKKYTPTFRQRMLKSIQRGVTKDQAKNRQLRRQYK